MSYSRAIWTQGQNLAYEKLYQKAQELLAKRMKEHKIPRLAYAPMGDNVLIYRLPVVEHKTASGLHLPDRVYEKDERGQERSVSIIQNVGLLLRGGLGALDWMRAHGVFPGDYVKFGRYSGSEERSTWFMPEAGTTISAADYKDFLQMDVGYVGGGFDAYERIWGENATMHVVYYVDEDGNGAHVLKPIEHKE